MDHPGTYTQNDGATPVGAGTIITVTSNNHGLETGVKNQIDFENWNYSRWNIYSN